MNTPVMVAIGVLSYSLYLWQNPFLSPESEQPYCRWPVNLGVIVVTATCSYLLIERPILRSSWGIRRTVGS